VSFLFRIPNRPRFRAGACFFQEAKSPEDSCPTLEKLWERWSAAVRSEVLAARGGVERAFEQHVLDGLDRSAARACDLVWGVLWVEALGVLPDEGMSCNGAVKGRESESGKLNCVCVLRGVGMDNELMM